VFLCYTYGVIIAAAIVAVTLASQPLQIPQEKRASESQGAQSTSTTENSNSAQRPPQQPQPASATSQKPANTNQPNGDSETENIRVQRRIEVFTGVLATVGVLQLVVMFLTWLVYRRQAGIMDQQRATMQSQWTTMQGQLAQMQASGGQTDALIAHAKTQAGHMEGQLTQMSVQSDILKKSVKAAEDGADAAKKNVDLLASKERARISVETPSKFEIKDGFFNDVKYRVHIFAPTPPIIVSAEVNAEIDDSDTLTYKWMHSMDIASIDVRQSTILEKKTLLIVVVDNNLRRLINEKKRFIHIYGTIKYRDIFQSDKDEPHETTFGYVWRVGTDVRGGFPQVGEGRWASGWEENPPGINKET